GVRKTISLLSSTRQKAAREAQAIHRKILRSGWGSLRIKVPALKQEDDRFSTAYWKTRLVRRAYLSPSGVGSVDFSVRIEFQGSAWYFPLGTSDPTTASERACAIFRRCSSSGWTALHSETPREISLAFFWSMDPVLWTYTTM